MGFGLSGSSLVDFRLRNPRVNERKLVLTRGVKLATFTKRNGKKEHWWNTENTSGGGLGSPIGVVR